MTGKTRSSLWARLCASSALAHAQRVPPREIDRGLVLAVAAVDSRMLTTPVSVMLAQLLAASTHGQVVLVDADGVNQATRGPAGAKVAGDIEALTRIDAAELNRARIQSCADTSGVVPVLAARVQDRRPLDPEVVESGVQRVRHRWPTVVVDLPFTCPMEVIAAGTRLAQHVVLVVDKHHQDHQWLYQPGHSLASAARQGRVTVLKVGASVRETLPKDTFALPAPIVGTTAQDRVMVPTDVESLTAFHRLLSRLYPSLGNEQ
ncbi:hypothetical protein P4N68_01575 [Corynebacterium felinum]|uniref:Uncharacterized protein n=1 Tax=Corynebacterium felinum TaxID=131318 RepID=A0ABU2B6Y4_9CORY|nr:hypothetical protein [Corynebacterium felinum]MDF5819770.1 hypothetical protein [Corynebacterium felinum]MDR7354363.1 hypothetical protein [Corynebacterium felinum]WJY93735.1 hypothetical protein CFELI_00390 [Corynebacterium felinum]